MFLLFCQLIYLNSLPTFVYVLLFGVWFRTTIDFCIWIYSTDSRAGRVGLKVVWLRMSCGLFWWLNEQNCRAMGNDFLLFFSLMWMLFGVFLLSFASSRYRTSGTCVNAIFLLPRLPSCRLVCGWNKRAI